MVDWNCFQHISDERIDVEVNTMGMNHTCQLPGSVAVVDCEESGGMISGSPGASDDHKSAHERHLPNQGSLLTAMITATPAQIQYFI